MADYSKELGLDRTRMERRIGFLEDRARWHSRRETPLDKACAATARRDAGIIMLLIGWTDAARKTLAEAGGEFLSIGIFSGYLLQSLAGPDHFDRDFAKDDMMARLRPDDVSTDPKERRERDEDARPFERQSRQSPQQLLNLYQALRGGRVSDPREGVAVETISERLRVSASVSVGLTGLPMGAYIPLFDRLGSNNASEREAQTLLATAVGRRELIAAARADEYHWRMLLKPAELVDLDFVALGMNALEAGESSSVMLLETTERVGIEAALPFLIARDLHEPPTEEPQPIYQYHG